MQRGERGFAFIAMLALLAIFALALSAAGPLWSDASKRDREQELLRLGALYASALKSFHDASPGSMAEYPLRLEQLLQDDRFVGVRRHLRKLYPDPVDPARPWGLVRNDRGGIIGVYSQSAARPLSSAPQQAPKLQRDAQRYSDWKFMAEEPRREPQ
jgi:type II secretory pathway pseudopilin PulG